MQCGTGAGGAPVRQRCRVAGRRQRHACACQRKVRSCTPAHKRPRREAR